MPQLNFRYLIREHPNLTPISNTPIWTARLVERPCALCGSSDNHVLYKKMQYGFDLNTVICDKCGLVFTNPMPEKTIYDSFYTEVYSDYYGQLASRGPSNYQNQAPEDIVRRMNWILNIAQLGGTRLLEIGPGHGLFLWHAARMGAEVLGIEPTPSFVSALKERGLPCLHGIVEQYDSTNLGTFDLIVMFHVFEHFYDPNGILEKMCALLGTDGLLVLEVPNILKPYRSLDRYFLRYVHPYNYSRYTLESLLNKHGLTIVFADEGDEDWRTPQNLFVIARKGGVDMLSARLQVDLDSIVSRLRKYQLEWHIWGQFRWGTHRAGIVARRLASRAWKKAKRHVARV